ncbi:IS6 family transposase [Natrialbaceae archaeon GCM10025810]|uniref:IS6 family transposase n=1 Tax=Halovalidus salilacus TaxID=3075124 RepID=UPI003610F0A2
MPEFSRLTLPSSDIQLEFVEREQTPCELMRLSIHLHLAGLSLSDTVHVLERFGVDRARSTVHNWVQKAELQPEDGKSPDHVAVDETATQLTDDRYWLFAAVDPETKGLTGIFLDELSEKHDVGDAVFLVDSADWLKAALHRRGYEFQYERHGQRNSIERVFKEVKRRTYQFGNCFRNADPETAETWLQSLAYCWNRLI